MEEIDPTSPVGKFWRFVTSHKHTKLLTIAITLIILAAVPLTVIVSQQQQQTKQEAATMSTSASCTSQKSSRQSSGCTCGAVGLSCSTDRNIVGLYDSSNGQPCMIDCCCPKNITCTSAGYQCYNTREQTCSSTSTLGGCSSGKSCCKTTPKNKCEYAGYKCYNISKQTCGSIAANGGCGSGESCCKVKPVDKPAPPACGSDTELHRWTTNAVTLSTCNSTCSKDYGGDYCVSIEVNNEYDDAACCKRKTTSKCPNGFAEYNNSTQKCEGTIKDSIGLIPGIACCSGTIVNNPTTVQCSFDGIKYNTGQSKDAYPGSSPACGTSCNQYKKTYTCTNVSGVGIWSPSVPISANCNEPTGCNTCTGTCYTSSFNCVNAAGTVVAGETGKCPSQSAPLCCPSGNHTVVKPGSTGQSCPNNYCYDTSVYTCSTGFKSGLCPNGTVGGTTVTAGCCSVPATRTKTTTGKLACKTSSDCNAYELCISGACESTAKCYGAGGSCQLNTSKGTSAGTTGLKPFDCGSFGGTWVSGYCPGPSNIMCCINTKKAPGCQPSCSLARTCNTTTGICNCDSSKKAEVCKSMGKTCGVWFSDGCEVNCGSCGGTNPPVDPPVDPTTNPTNTPTTNPGAIMLALNVGLDGIGAAGDHPLPCTSLSTCASNKNPVKKIKDVEVSVLDSSNTNKTPGLKTTLTYDSTTGTYKGTVPVNVSAGQYTVKVKPNGLLAKKLVSIQNLVSGTNQIPSASITTGDIDNDNNLTVLDYNILISCSQLSRDNKTTCNKSSNYTEFSDLTNDGKIDLIDYNLFLREYSVQNGD